MKSTIIILVSAIALTIITGCISPELRTARIAVNERDWDRAMTAVNEEISRVGPSAEPYYLKGMIHEQREEWALMSASYDSSLSYSDMFAEKIDISRKRLVARFVKQSIAEADTAEADSTHWVKSLEYADIAIVIQPKEVRLYQHATVMAYNAGFYDRAIKYANEAIRLEQPGKADLGVREVLVAVYSSKGDNVNSLKWAQDLIKRVDPIADSVAYLRTHDALLAVYEKTENYDAAIEVIEDAIKHFPNRSPMMMNLALMHVKKKDYQSAGEVYRQVVLIDSTNFDANLNLGTILVTDKKWAEAIPYLKRAHEIDPTNINAIRNLLASYYETGQDKLGKEMRLKYEALQKEGD